MFLFQCFWWTTWTKAKIIRPTQSKLIVRTVECRSSYFGFLFVSPFLWISEKEACLFRDKPRLSCRSSTLSLIHKPDGAFFFLFSLSVSSLPSDFSYPYFLQVLNIQFTMFYRTLFCFHIYAFFLSKLNLNLPPVFPVKQLYSIYFVCILHKFSYPVNVLHDMYVLRPFTLIRLN